MPAFASVALDVESTVTGVEGINWLAARRGRDLAASVEALTERAMRGEIRFEEIYGERLALVRPTEVELADLAEEYLSALAPGAIEVIEELRASGVRLVLISGGIRQALLPLAFRLGFTAAELFAVRVAFDARGAYTGFEESSPLSVADGKESVLRRLYLPRPLLAVGDGATDVAMRPAADAFAAYTGFTHRMEVARSADHELRSFDDLRRLVL
jgi:phosphoserine phosphatase